MTVSVKKWGNSLAFRIPKDIAKTLHIENESTLELHVQNGMMTIEPTKDDLLLSLVSRIDASNLHSEINAGEGMGNEEW